MVKPITWDITLNSGTQGTSIIFLKKKKTKKTKKKITHALCQIMLKSPWTHSLLMYGCKLLFVNKIVVIKYTPSSVNENYITKH